MTPMTTPKGEWYAICATGDDKRSGSVHCYPSNDGVSKIFEGCAGAFVQMEADDGTSKMCIAVLRIDALKGNDAVSEFLMLLSIHELDSSSSVEHHPEEYPFIVGFSPRPIPEIFIDLGSQLAVIVAASTVAQAGPLAFIFELKTGRYVKHQPLNTLEGEYIFSGRGGLHVEKEGLKLQRLMLYPDGPPTPIGVCTIEQQNTGRNKTARSKATKGNKQHVSVKVKDTHMNWGRSAAAGGDDVWVYEQSSCSSRPG